MICTGAIKTAIELQDNFTTPAQNMAIAATTLISTIDHLGSSMEQDISTSNISLIENYFNWATTAAESLQQTIENVGQEINQNIHHQNDFTQSIKQSDAASGNLVKTIAGLSMVQSAISLVKGQLDSAISRMDTMTNFDRTMTAITGSADAAAASLASLKDMTKGTAYGLDTAAAAVQNFAARGMNIGAATAEVGKWADAVAFYGDGTNDTLTNVTDAIGKMFTKGKVEMDQLDRLTDAGINAVGIYAQAVGRNTASVQDDLSKGTISAQDFVTTVSTAFEEGTNGVLNIAGAAKEAGGTWATSIANAKAAITRGLIDMIESINEGLSQAGFGTILDGITEFGAGAETVLSHIGTGIENIIILLSPLLHGVQTVGSFMADNWSIIEPIVYGIVAALTAYAAVSAVVATINRITAITEDVKAASQMMAAGATLAQTAAQKGLNAALMACPITWIVSGILALIVVFYMVIAAVNKFKGTSISATGIICGAFAVAGAFLLNTAIGVINSIIQVIWSRFVYPILAIVEWILNVCNGGFDSFGDAVANLIGQIIGWFLGLGKIVTTIIDAIFGTNWTAGLESLQNTVTSWGKNEKAITLDKNAPVIDYRITYAGAFSSGYQTGQRVADRVSGMFTNTSVDTDIPTALDGIYQNTADTAKDTAAIADALDITKSELKYIRDFAEAKAINRYTTAEIKINMTNHNNINSDSDIDSFVIKLRDKLEEEMLASAEGVH